MNNTILSQGSPRAQVAGGLLYSMVWKWHFLASLYVLPFLFMLSLTGGIYLYKPQIEAWLYQDALSVPTQDQIIPYEAQVAAVQERVGISRLRGITQYEDQTRSTLIEFDDLEKNRSYAWVDPYTGKVLKTVERDLMPMRLLRKFHGELLLGSFGTKFVEIAAHWSIVMFVTGLFLWWPRGQRTLFKALSLPKGQGRHWWRETHMFTGLLASLLIVPVIITGLPWADVWGGGLSYIQQQTGTASKSLRFGGDVPNSTQSEGQVIPYASVFAVAQNEGLAPPYELRPPKNSDAAFWIRSANTQRTAQTELIVDQYSGTVLKRHYFSDNPEVAKLVSFGISFHQGELYGWFNLVQNTMAAALGIILSVSGYVSWWKRRPKGSLGIPNAPDRALSRGIVLVTIFLAILFPLMGLTLIIALAADRVIFRRLSWFQETKS